MDGFDIFIHRKNNWVNPGRDGVALNMDREKKMTQWMKMEEIMTAARDRYLDNDVPFYTVMAETMEQINEARNVLIEQAQQFDPMAEAIEEDKKIRQEEDAEIIRGMNLQ